MSRSRSFPKRGYVDINGGYTIRTTDVRQIDSNVGTVAGSLANTVQQIDNHAMGVAHHRLVTTVFHQDVHV